MAKNLLVINCDIRETRVALIENGIIAELHLERDSQVGTLGNIYLGKVSRVLPGMQAAFIDIGLERAAFLHVEDLIRPDDFEAYLAGHRTAMGGAQEAKTDDGSDAPSEEEATVASGGAPTSAPAAAPPAHAPGVSRGGTTAPQGPARAGQGEEGGERRGRRRRRGRGRRNGGEGPRPGESQAGAPGEAQLGADAGLARGGFEGDDEGGDGDEPESLLDPSAGDEVLIDRSESADDVSASEAASPPPAASASSGPPSGGGPRAWSLLDPSREPRATTEAEAPPPSVDRVEGGAERAVEGEDDAAAAPPVAATADEDAPTPSRRRRSRKSRSTTRGTEPEAEAEAPVSVEAPASIDALAAELGDVGTSDAELSGRDASLDDSGVVEVADADGEGEGGEALEDEGVLEPPAEAGAAEDEAGTRARRSRRGRARTRRSGSTAERREKMAAVVAAPPTPSSQRKAKAEPLRVSKSTPIREVVREGQEVIVQVSKEPIGTKGARVTSHVSLPGRYVVYLPTVEHVGISKRIGSDKERSRLRAAIDAMKPPTGGLIVRTLAEGLTKKDLKNDVGYLVRLWGEVIKKREASTKRAPDCLYTELDIVLRTARDLFTDDIEKIIIDDRQQYERLKRFIEMFMPERVDAIELYEGSEPIFDEYGIEEEIGRALARKVPLESGGYLIIDQAEALTAIDVNTGKFVGKGSTDLEDTILKTNLEAVQEIAYQLRFRNLGGLIVLDLIDMEKAANREKVRRRLEELLAKDKAKTTLNRISDLGLIEMTRKRTRESLSRTMNEPCFYCDGTGNLQSKQTIAYEILRQIKRERANLRGYVVMVNAHPAVVDLLKHEERAAVIEAERRYQRRIDLVPRKEYHLEQFDLVGR